MTLPLLMLLPYRLYLQIIFIAMLIDGFGPVNLVLLTLLLEVVNLNLNIKEGHTEIWGNLCCCTAPYTTTCISVLCIEQCSLLNLNVICLFITISIAAFY